MVNGFFRQFSGPTGLLGQVAGRLMARLNGPLNDWVVDLLELSARDRVLEVGFGPGLAVERIAARTSEGLVVGVDHSELMRRHAARRNREALASGRVELHVGSAGKLLLESARFTHALAVNSLQFWPDLPAALAELHRVLAPQGRLALAIRMRRDGAGLGLALVRQIARHHGGDARYLPREGGGSCFEVELSAAEPEAASSSLANASGFSPRR